MIIYNAAAPRVAQKAAQAFDGAEFIVPTTSDIVVELDAMATALTGYIVLQVVVADDDRRRTHIYRSAGAAQRAVERARQRGRAAHVTLCQLLPVGVVVGLGGDR